MPEVRFEVRWPDDSTSLCYSPSSTIRDYFNPGQPYPLKDFVRLSQAALNHASERVRQRYGFACSSAAQQLSEIERRALAYEASAGATVTVLRFE
ncbi:MSMEG_0570 family nitrogen starvation response protein [Nevskia ramosa]|uniref:MSMEG_0570 family nitrogen starvation response protein n=1 Tax=Nevskia ramosa TaxID=64002 RepID=UPI0003B62F9B|nr:MSMEG_0570 family nitrogen starvation response protein [Nevskia ramosa]